MSGFNYFMNPGLGLGIIGQPPLWPPCYQYSMQLQQLQKLQQNHMEVFGPWTNNFDISYSEYGSLLEKFKADYNRLFAYFSSLQSDSSDKKVFCENYLAYRDQKEKKEKVEEDDKSKPGSWIDEVPTMMRDGDISIVRDNYILSISEEQERCCLQYVIVSNYDKDYEVYTRIKFASNAQMMQEPSALKESIIPIGFDTISDVHRFIDYYKLEDVAIKMRVFKPGTYFAYKKEEKEMDKMGKEESKEMDEIVAAIELKKTIKLETRKHIKKKFKYVPKFLRKAMLTELTEKDIEDIIKDVNAEVCNKVTGGGEMTGGIAKIYGKLLKKLGFNVDMEELQEKVKVIAADSVHELIAEWKEKGDIK